MGNTMAQEANSWNNYDDASDVSHIEGNTARKIDVPVYGEEDWEDKCGHGGIYSAKHPLVRYEVIDGAAYDMSPRPNFLHGLIIGNIGTNIKRILDERKSPCRVFMDAIDFHYHYNVKGKEEDYVEPDIAIVCDKSLFRGGSYYGPLKFVAEVISPSSAKRDMTDKLHIYEETGVSEYWIVNPQGSVMAYYLEDGHYTLHATYILCDDEYDECYNENEVIALRDYPNVKMTLGSIFE